MSVWSHAIVPLPSDTRYWQLCGYIDWARTVSS